MIALLVAAGTIAVLPVEARPGALSAADAAALTDHLRAVARDALASHDLSVSDDESGAVAVVRSRAAALEGATVVAVGVYKPGVSEPAGLARIVGIGLPQLKADAGAKLPRLLATSLGFAPPAATLSQRAGTLRIPGATPAPAPPAPPPPPAAPSPVAAAPAAPAPVAAPAPPPANEDPLVTLIREVTSDVERLRGLRRKQSLKVQILDDKLFTAALRAKAAQELTKTAVAAERARWLAFDLAPASADPGQIMLDVLDEQVAGFYDQFTKQLIVRKEVPASAGAAMGPDGLRIVLAHEIEHALQDQNFGIPDMSTLADDDARLARSALFEGDAMAVMTAYAAMRARRPVKAAIAGGAAALRAVDTETLLRLSGKSPALASAPAILREELVLPYSAGFALVADAFRRGGWPLVDRMFQHPPVSGQQVLHPELYFAGRTPAPVAPPAVPTGMKLVARGRMGELGTRLALEVCADKSVVKDLMPHWAGDAYTLVSDGKRSLSLLWATVWSDGTASNVANLIKLEPPCWEDQSASFGPQGWRVDAPSKAAVRGETVAVARGSIELDAAMRQLLAAKPQIPAASPPLGEVPPPPSPKPVRIADGKFVSEQLGLTGELPPEFKPVDNPAAELSLQKAGFGGVALALVSEPLSGEALDTFFQVTAAQLANAEGGHLQFSGRAQVKLAGASADERSWKIEGQQQAMVRIEVAPWCDGRGALALMRVERNEDAHQVLDRFAASVQRAPGLSPACSDLQ